jgi:ribosome-binding protein aMBF1 (putative translation factor)
MIKKMWNEISPRGQTWDEVRDELYTPDEIRESDIRVAIISELIKARNERGISQRDLEQLSGVKQPVISRMEAGMTSPHLDTVIKVLAALGKTLYIGELKKKNASS